jgi:hypothetical protein
VGPTTRRDQLIERVVAKLAEAALAIEHRDPARLTGEERIALAVVAGVAWEVGPTKLVDGQYMLTLTTEPVDITVVNGRWTVSVLPPQKTKE